MRFHTEASSEGKLALQTRTAPSAAVPMKNKLRPSEHSPDHRASASSRHDAGGPPSPRQACSHPPDSRPKILPSLSTCRSEAFRGMLCGSGNCGTSSPSKPKRGCICTRVASSRAHVSPVAEATNDRHGPPCSVKCLDLIPGWSESAMLGLPVPAPPAPASDWEPMSQRSTLRPLALSKSISHCPSSWATELQSTATPRIPPAVNSGF
mmetsp:Transcript_6200/g.17665  ORF Transcript_6200/g.17665 Transcript_6200/m.17665 type:complete len:208 (-) Transcript_6200:2336-2959(-)